MVQLVTSPFFYFLILCLPHSNNVVLESGDKYSLNEDGSELLIKDVKKVDEGDYTCMAKNKAGEKSEEVSLNVFGERFLPLPFQTRSGCSSPVLRADILLIVHTTIQMNWPASKTKIWGKKKILFVFCFFYC